MPLDPVRMLYVGRVSPDPQWGMPPHRHTFHELIAVADGAMRVTTAHGAITALAGDVLFYPAGMTHAEQSDQLAPVSTLYLSFSWTHAAATMPLCVHDPRRRIGLLLHWLFDDRDLPLSQAGTVRDSLAQTILAEYLRLISYEEPTMLATIRAYIRAHIAEELTLDDLAGVAGVSKYHFIRRYLAQSQCTPMDDVRRIRVEMARELLLSTDLPLKSIAARVGLASEQHLARLVRRYAGMSPGEIRRQVSW